MISNRLREFGTFKRIYPKVSFTSPNMSGEFKISKMLSSLNHFKNKFNFKVKVKNLSTELISGSFFYVF